MDALFGDRRQSESAEDTRITRPTQAFLHPSVRSERSATMLFLTGPTAVGKSEIAVAVAGRIGAEIIGADAFQVYEGMEILTAKPAPELRKRVPHHLIGTVPLHEIFDVARYRSAALRAVADIEARGRRALVVGGTGLYVRALHAGLANLPQADAALREELSAASLGELQARLQALDPESAARIDMKNPRRLIRAIEVCILTGEPFSKHRSGWAARPPLTGVLLVRDREELAARIRQRTMQMFRTGLLEEVRALPPLGPTAAQAIGLREARACLAGEISETEAAEQITLATRRYAKRQLTWFRREPSLRVFDLSTPSSPDSLIAAIARHLQGRSPSAND
jgi:tRNA dimethylallyltransferase